ncbi:hypothetical protein AXF42_Ash016289 [Apostasia shenzhenica]|uniref:Uncharacterized protein n=1 Tax=Apostasia shenzhenica TaxID=1088818 RepID=A0A2H9ZXE6_9ASPA|nr:hypothetical protein AXF42_Ash016289 [Apostasia shenzhenica]
MVKKHENSLCYWDRDGDGEILPDFFYQRCVDRADQGQPCSIRGNQREDDFGIERHHSPITMDGSDNVDVAASDSSEVDTLWQLDLSKSACRNDSGGSKIKKPQIKPAKNPYFRTPTRVKSRIPRQPSSGVKDVKRASSSGGKLSSEK